ncbi:MAG: peptidylprolyl isomerase [Trueperaceae bacterium]|nr:peptidylprolyl isomerase [Trueperaceae bacterium]
MRQVMAVALVVAALLAGGAWVAYGDLWGGGVTPAPRAEGTPNVADAPRADAEGYAAVPFRSDEPVRRFDGPEQVLAPDTDYRAEIDTTAGTLTVDLYEGRTPRTVENFVFLALHRYYEGVSFHRVLDDFMAQTGDPSGTGAGGPGYTFEDEIKDGLRHDRPGLLSMANRGPDTNGSQFFITFAATPWLDGNHTVFGEVRSGLEVLDALTRIDPQNPSIVAGLSAPAATLAEQGVEAARGADGTVEDWLREELESVPDEGRSFQIGARRGVMGRATGELAVGLFPVPDRIESVTILARPDPDDD